MQNVLSCCFCDTLQSSSDTVSQDIRAEKEHPSGALFLRVPHVLKLMAPRPMLTNQAHNTHAPQVTDLSRWTRVGRKKRLGRGRGPFRAKNFFQYIPCPFRKINLVLKNVRFNLSNFLHAALNWRDDDNLLVPLFHGFIFKTIFPTFSTFLS